MNFSIRKKFTLIAIAGLISMFLMIHLTRAISKESLQNLQNVFLKSQEIHEIDKNFIYPLFKIQELSLILATNKRFKNDTTNKISSLIKTLDQNFITLNDQNLQKNWKKYKSLVLLEKKNLKIKEQFDILLKQIKYLQDDKLKTSHQTFQTIKQEIYKNEKFIFFASFLIIVFSFLLFFTIVNNIVNSIDTLQNGLKKFFDLLDRKVSFKSDIFINTHNKDEFFAMATMVNKNIQVLKARLENDLQLIKNATSVVEELKAGHLHRRFAIDNSVDELNELKIVLNEMLDNLEKRIHDEIKKRVQKEQLLIQQSKLACMGNMIGNIAHQWRQPLGEISAILMNLEAKKDHHDLSNDEFEQILNECNIILSHMSNTISDFQNFFKPSKQKKYFWLQKSCESASFIIASSLKHNNIKFILNIEEEVKVFGYPREFSQTILNLLSNAKDVLMDRKIKNPFIKLSIKKGKKFALVSVEDNGGGIDEQIKDRIYEPYFTTKHAKAGTGIGLYMSKIIIEENMQGHIGFKNTDKGALFIVKLRLNH